MTAAELRAIVLEALGEIAPEVEPQQLRGDVPLGEQLDLDSIDLLELLERIGERTGVEVPERDYAKVATLDDCVDYLLARLAPA
jgi:acyl carrier protein